MAKMLLFTGLLMITAGVAVYLFLHSSAWAISSMALGLGLTLLATKRSPLTWVGVGCLLCAGIAVAVGTYEDFSHLSKKNGHAASETSLNGNYLCLDNATKFDTLLIERLD
jgi:hypothetical protein